MAPKKPNMQPKANGKGGSAGPRANLGTDTGGGSDSRASYWRQTWAKLAGLIYQGKRDMFQVFGYRPQPGWKDYYAKYIRQGIARRVINAPVEATWRNPPTLIGPQGLENAWKILCDQQQLWSEVQRVDKLAGIGNYAVMLLGFDDITSQDTMVKPVRNGAKLLFLKCYSQVNAQVFQLVQDPTDPRFGQPLAYRIQLGSQGVDFGNKAVGNSVAPAITPDGVGTLLGVTTVLVHYTRILHVADDTLENDILGTPRLEPIINDLDDLMKITGGTAETFWLNANRGLQIDIDKDSQLTPGDADALNDEIEDYVHNQSRVIRTRGITITPMKSDVPNPTQAFGVIMSVICGSTGIPQRILLGSEAGQLASDQDRANWADRIKERRVSFAEPRLLIPLVLKLMEAGCLPQVTLDKFSFYWPQSFQLTPLEEAQMMAQKARAAINLSKSLATNPLITFSECRGLLGFSPEIPADLPKGPVGIMSPQPNPISTDGNPKTDPSSVEKADGTTQQLPSSPGTDSQSSHGGTAEE